MPATRTQIYFSGEQRSRIDRAADARGITMAELVRRAIDDYLGREIDPTEILAGTFGAAPDAEVRPRDEWERG